MHCLNWKVIPELDSDNGQFLLTSRELGLTGPAEAGLSPPAGDRYKWVALSNTTAAVLMATMNGSIVLIAMPAIFRGIGLDPLAPQNISYLLWMIMGYRL